MKKKLVLVTAIATLTASLSVFSSLPSSAKVGQSSEMIVIDVEATSVLVAIPELWDSTPTGHRVLCNFYTLGTESPEFAPIAEQVKYGDMIHFSGDGEVVFTAVIGINGMYCESGNCELEIVGSVLDEPFENFDSVTVDGQTSIQITGADGTRYVFEEGAVFNEVAAFVCWEHDAGYTGIYYDKGTDSDKYSEELANEYNRESGHPIWIRPNEDGDVNSDDKVDSADAAVILEDIALNAVGETGRMNASENKAADVNGDGVINAKDAAVILSYSAQVGSGMLEGVSLKAYAVQ
ncbi:MAG: dockerin type I repeat-containing protein [Oscillospiraceae bacterium]|nr:dockerin type I repeat-containing protein [Oscillospiraceae bacterium]